MASELDFKSAFSVFSKLPHSKKNVVGRLAFELFQKKISEAEAPAVLGANGLNEVEVQLGIVVARHQVGELARLGPAKSQTAMNFAKALSAKAVGEDKIALTLRGVSFTEEEIRIAIDFIRQNAPESSILEAKEGRGKDEFSETLRKVFSLVKNEFLLIDPMARFALARGAAGADFPTPVRLLIQEASVFSKAVRAGKPFWWEAEHEKVLVDSLVRRLPEMIFAPYKILQEKIKARVSGSEIARIAETAGVAADVQLLFKEAMDGKNKLDWNQNVVPGTSNMDALFRQTFGAWIWFFYEKKDSPEYKKRMEVAESFAAAFIATCLNGEHFAPGLSDADADLAHKCAGLLASLPLPSSKKFETLFRTTDPQSTHPVARYFRQLF